MRTTRPRVTFPLAWLVVWKMFIKKITKINHVGKFKKAQIKGGEYKKYTLIYGGNGRGKTTICSILRSLQLNDPTHINRRRTFKVDSACEVHLLLDSGTVNFNGTKWAAHHADIHIFDHQFVLDNIHTGNDVGIDQRRNFYRIIVGPEGVALATEIDALDAAATAAQTAITAEKKALQQHVPKTMTLESWLALPADPDIATKITAAKAAIVAAENATEIATRSSLTPISVPALPADFASTLTKGLPELAAEAAALVAGQMAKHGFHGDGDAWLSKGLERVVDDDCPFCGASVAGNALIEAYQGYFSKAYAAHLEAIQGGLAALKAAVGPSVSLKVAQGVSAATADAEFWLRYCPHAVVVAPELQGAAAALTKLYEAAKAQLELKAASPLDTPPQSVKLDAALAAWGKLTTGLLAVNTAMMAGNILIDAVKRSSASSTLPASQADLAKLLVIEKRHATEIVDMVRSYWLQVEAKNLAVKQKHVKKEKLDAYDAQVLGGYEKDINTYLEIFNAPFKLDKCGKSYQGRLPQSTYCLQFDDHYVDVAASPQGTEPSFSTTLSAGDKSTFALAFFLAQIKRDPDIAKKVVVFDDPFTSLDDFRREMTAKAIYRVGQRASQVIVFSHDKYFLDSIRNKIHPAADMTSLQLSVSKNGSCIEEWDIELEVKEGYLQDHLALCEYIQEVTNEDNAIKTKLRPLIEQYIRYRFPNQIKSDMWLGEMLAVIRVDSTHPLYEIYDKLDDINKYTAPFHHNPNTPCNPDEVRAHAKLTLEIMGGW
jgi:wobble nucleotide-excising tRNase